MAVSVKPELIRGTSITAKRHGNSQFTDVLICTGLTNANDFPTMEAAARAAASPVLTVLGIAHDVETNYFLDNVRTELISATSVRMYATYKSYPATEYRFEVFGSLGSKTIYADYNGDALTLQKPSELDDDTEPAYYNEDTVAMAPQTVVRMTKIGFGNPTLENATFQSGGFTGHTNSNPFLGENPGRWLVTRYEMSKSNLGGIVPWKRVIEIQYDPDTWRVWKAWRLSDGRVSYYQDNGLSMKYFTIYGPTRFASEWLGGM